MYMLDSVFALLCVARGSHRAIFQRTKSIAPAEGVPVTYCLRYAGENVISRTRQSHWNCTVKVGMPSPNGEFWMVSTKELVVLRL